MAIKEQKKARIYKELDKILDNLDKQSRSGEKIHEVELHLFHSLLALGLLLLKHYIGLVRQIRKSKGKPVDSTGKKMRNKGRRSCQYFSLFGRIEIDRIKYYSKADKTYYALDADLGLPKDTYSYVLTDWMSYGSVEMDFEQSVKQLERILGHSLWGMQSSRQTYSLSKEVDTYYSQKDWSEQEEEGTHFSVGFDGKGIPIIRSETDRAKESTSVRLGKGKKRGVKKEATVSVSSSFTAKKRSAEEIITALFHKEQPVLESPKVVKHQWHEHKHVRAFLSDKVKAISYGIDNVLKRDQTKSKPLIVLIDGDRALEKAVLRVVKEKGIADRMEACILDFIHVLEYVWKVANAKLGEKNPDREAWVERQARLLLNSQTDKVLEEWRAIKKEKKLKPTQALNLKKAITYLSNHKHMVKYKTYLRRGYPITTGAVESACGHFIKSRMERNAMHWGKKGAQEMMNIRAIKKNDDWDDYLEKFIEKEQKQLYPELN